MAFHSSSESLEDLNITKQELKEIGEALKKEDFRKLLNNYFEEINDPKNKAIYEQELTEYERQRGIDITFIHPEPGYVIKSSVDGKKKAFINICSNEKVNKPSSSVSSQDGTPGLNWSIPYLQGHPRDDLDNKNERCTVFDVVFHPDTLYLAQKNVRIKKLVNDIALTAVEDSFKVKIDRKNLVFPKMNYKGCKIATVIRKMRDDFEDKNAEAMDDVLPNYPYPYPPPKEEVPNVVKPRTNVEDSDNLYTIPRYILKQRRDVDWQECTNGQDAKFHGAIPNELVVEIDLPLIRSAADVNLDVVDKSLCLNSEKPAKYKLNINLPYSVDDEKGNAKFDKAKKKLIVVLPVKKCKFTPPDFIREDSGIESDANQNTCSSSEEDIRKNVQLIQINDGPAGETCGDTEETNTSGDLRTSEEVKTHFLNPDFHYSFPINKISFTETSISVRMSVKNIDPQSVAHKFVDVNEGVHIKFCSLGSGFYPIHYAFCIKIPEIKIDTTSLNIDVWDNCLTATLKVNSPIKQIESYYIGTSLDSLKEEKMILKGKDKKLSSETGSTDYTELILNSIDNCKLTENDETNKSEIKDNSDLISRENVLNESDKISKEENVKEENLETNSSSIGIANSQILDKSIFKNRTMSESIDIPVSFSCGKRSILKGSRSLSESHTDDYNTWSSLDSESHEDLISSKKTVRFNDVVSEKIFRANSSILGQRKKNEKKSKNRKKRANERMLSAGSEESETDRDDCESVSELSDLSSDDSSGGSSSSSSYPTNTAVPSSKKHRRRGVKNKRKAAAIAKHSQFID